MVSLAPWGKIKSTWRSDACSIFCPVLPNGIDRKSCSLSGDQPAVDLANESQSEAVCGVAHPSSAEAFFRPVEIERVADVMERKYSLTGSGRHM